MVPTLIYCCQWFPYTGWCLNCFGFLSFQMSGGFIVQGLICLKNYQGVFSFLSLSRTEFWGVLNSLSYYARWCRACFETALLCYALDWLSLSGIIQLFVCFLSSNTFADFLNSKLGMLNGNTTDALGKKKKNPKCLKPFFFSWWYYRLSYIKLGLEREGRVVFLACPHK